MSDTTNTQAENTQKAAEVTPPPAAVRDPNAPLTDKDILDDFNLDISQDSTQSILQRVQMIKQEASMYQNESYRINHEIASLKGKITENRKKMEMAKQLPYLVSNVQEVLDNDAEERNEDGSAMEVDVGQNSKAVIIKTTTRRVGIDCMIFREFWCVCVENIQVGGGRTLNSGVCVCVQGMRHSCWWRVNWN